MTYYIFVEDDFVNIYRLQKDGIITMYSSSVYVFLGIEENHRREDLITVRRIPPVAVQILEPRIIRYCKYIFSKLSS